MPGHDKSRIIGIDQDQLDELTCSICQDVLNKPMFTACCRLSYCKDCITEWLSTHNTCPNDRKPLTSDGLTEPPRFVNNLIDKMRIMCEFSDKGCDEVVLIADLDAHTSTCKFGARKCGTCGGLDNTPDHDCVAYLLQENLALRDRLKSQVKESTEAIARLQDDLDRLSVSGSSPSSVSDEIQKKLADAICQAKGKKLAIFKLNRIDQVDAEKFVNVIEKCIEKFDRNSMTTNQLLLELSKQINDVDRLDKWSVMVYLSGGIDYSLWASKSIWLKWNELIVYLFTKL